MAEEAEVMLMLPKRSVDSTAGIRLAEKSPAVGL
jgi:hypothetical protein